MERVAFVSVHGCPVARLGERDTGGMNVYLLQVARQLGERGIKVDIYTRYHDPEDPQVVYLGENTRVIHLLAGSYREPKESLYHYLPQFLYNVRRYQVAQGLSYDLVHSHYWLSGWVATFLAQSWDVPHVTTFHTLAEVKKRARSGEQEPEERIAGEAKVVQEADSIVAFSRHEAEALTRFYNARPGKIDLVPCGVDLGLFKPRQRSWAKKQLGVQDKKLILFVGRVEPIKAIDLLVKAVADLEDPDRVRLMVVGGNLEKDREVKRTKALAKDLGIQELVLFPGSVPQERLPIYYSAADIFALPSYYESFGLAALEAMACGTPVLASRVGGLKDAVRDGITGYLIPWRCPEPYTERIEMLLSNEKLRSTMGKAARQWARKHSWSNVADQLLSLYQDLVCTEPCGSSSPAAS